MNIHPCRTMREAEEALFASGSITSAELMDIAILAAVDTLQHDPAYARAAEQFEHVIVYAGKGKNAGDALGIALGLGFSRVILRSAVPPGDMAADTRRILAGAAPGAVSQLAAAPDLSTNSRVLIIDGLLGSGATGPLRPPYAALVQEMNDLRAAHPHSSLLAVDIPTGLHADEGLLQAPAVQADATLAIGCVKPGMLADGAEDSVGRLLCVPLPQVPLPETSAQVLDASTPALLPRRPYSYYKNCAGRVRIIAGSVGYLGAAQMCAEAAMYAGAGLVELYCRADVYPLLAVRVAPEVMVRPVDTYAEVPTAGADALLIGPGLGQPNAADCATLRRLVEAPPCPLVLDADGLNLAAGGGWHPGTRCILTPHPGEMRRLYPAAARMSRAATAAAYVAEHPCTLLLKGARTLITDGVRTCYNSTGGPYMANGGHGDVLSGVIAALVAQKLAPLQAAALAAYTCGLAADRAHRSTTITTATREMHQLFRAMPPMR